MNSLELVSRRLELLEAAVTRLLGIATDTTVAAKAAVEFSAGTEILHEEWAEARKEESLAAKTPSLILVPKN